MTDTEEYLAQAQNRGGGSVVYTGLNNRGDFYIGNKRISSASGKESSFGIPIPTITVKIHLLTQLYLMKLQSSRELM